ncbi:MAG: beta-lactamase family protein [Candidatus Izimaplasma sp.]|nr:beta-lactamase family protein [Candidatus Izimaplasma bacterium]
MDKKKLITDISSLLKSGVEKKDFPGASYAVIFKDGTIYSDYVGYKQVVPTKEINKGNEIYDCASLTKVISTTSMIMKLIEEQKLSLDTKVQEIIPRFIHPNITVYHLLTHTSGLPADIKRANTLVDKDDVLNRIFNFELINEVGKKIVYSDIGFIILGLIIEKLTNKRLDVYANEVVFNPLKMDNTSYRPNKANCAPTEFRDDEVYKGLLKGLVHDEKSFALNGLSGHAGMFSTSNDLAKFILSFLRNDEIILKKETIDSLFIEREKDINQNGVLLIRALGWQKKTKGSTSGDNTSYENTILHTGFTGCNIWIDKLAGIGFVLLSNAVHPKRENNGIGKYRNMIGNMIIPSEVK